MSKVQEINTFWDIKPLRLQNPAAIDAGVLAGIWVPSIAPIASLKYGKNLSLCNISEGHAGTGSLTNSLPRRIKESRTLLKYLIL